MAHDHDLPDLDRRRLLAAGAAAYASVWAASAAAPAAAAAAEDEALLTVLSDITLPATGTPGAVAAGVPRFVIFAMREGLRGAKPSLLRELETVLDGAAGQPFRGLGRERQIQVLTDVDARTVAQPGSPWGLVKTLIVSGYYTSEIGASQELTYDPVPGWDPEVPVTPDFRNFAPLS